MNFSETKSVVVIDSHHGIYIGQIFAQMYEPYLRTKIGDEDTNTLLNPDDDDYIEVWANLFPIELSNEKNEVFIFDEIEGDVWEIPKNEYDLIDWDECC